MRLVLVFFLTASSAAGQTNLRERIAAIAKESQGKVSVACSLPGSTLNCDLEPHSHPPMQSVFKLPLALYMLHLVEQGKFSLDQPIRYLASDRMPHWYSPLQEKYPNAEVDVPLRELLRLAVSLSDNAAADLLLRISGGPAATDAYIKSLGISGFQLRDSEHVLHRESSAQYNNWFEPAAAVQLLRRINDDSPLNPEHTKFLLEWMRDAPTGAGRIKGNLPAGTVIMHKTGTSGTTNGVTPATNDIGLIVLPDRRQLAIAVFVTDSKAAEAAREEVIARIARAAYDAATSGTN